MGDATAVVASGRQRKEGGGREDGRGLGERAADAGVDISSRHAGIYEADQCELGAQEACDFLFSIERVDVCVNLLESIVVIDCTRFG